MKDIVKNFAALIKVKTVVTFAVCAVFVYLSVIGKIETDRIMDVVIMVISFYFGVQHEKKGED